MTEIDAVLEQLLAATGASRVTVREDVAGDVFPVTHEALADGVRPIRGVATPDMARQPVVLEIQKGRQVVQDDCLAASEEPHFRVMLELSPADHYAHYALGRALEKQGKDTEANGHYKLASSLRPDSEQYRARIRELG